MLTEQKMKNFAVTVKLEKLESLGELSCAWCIKAEKPRET